VNIHHMGSAFVNRLKSLVDTLKKIINNLNKDLYIS